MWTLTSGIRTTAWWPLAWSSRTASRMLSQWLPSMGTTSTFPASAHRPTHRQSRSPASTCHWSCSPRAISAQTRSYWLSGGAVPPIFVSFILWSSHLSKMACHWKAVRPQNNHYKINLCLCFITSGFTQRKITPPFPGKTPLTCCFRCGAFQFTLLFFIQDPKQDCACPFPWSPPTSLLTVLSGPGLNSEESPLPRSPPRVSAACDLLWELFKLLPPIMGEHGAHPGR